MSMSSAALCCCLRLQSNVDDMNFVNLGFNDLTFRIPSQPLRPSTAYLRSISQSPIYHGTIEPAAPLRAAVREPLRTLSMLMSLDITHQSLAEASLCDLPSRQQEYHTQM